MFLTSDYTWIAKTGIKSDDGYSELLIIREPIAHVLHYIIYIIPHAYLFNAGNVRIFIQSFDFCL